MYTYVSVHLSPSLSLSFCLSLSISMFYPVFPNLTWPKISSPSASPPLSLRHLLAPVNMLWATCSDELTVSVRNMLKLKNWVWHSTVHYCLHPIHFLHFCTSSSLHLSDCNTLLKKSTLTQENSFWIVSSGLSHRKVKKCHLSLG